MSFEEVQREYYLGIDNIRAALKFAGNLIEMYHALPGTHMIDAVPHGFRWFQDRIRNAKRTDWRVAPPEPRPPSGRI